MNPIKLQQKTYTLGSLFAGIGGIDIGFKKAGFVIKWANEIDKNACKTYRLNHDNVLYECDIKDLDEKKVEKVDILTAGFPCQAFSIAGYQKGFKDERGNVYFEILRFIDEINPRVIFLENVKNLKSHDNGNTYKVIKESLEYRGYLIKDKVINSVDFIPQNRERIYIVAFRDKITYENFEFPKPKKLKKSIFEILEKEVDDKFYYHNSKYYPMLKQTIIKKDTIYQLRRVYVRENKSKVCPTLTANMGTGGHNVPLILDDKGIRKLTPRECAKFQGLDEIKFPDIALSHQYKQIGNSVTVLVIEAIAKEIKKALECVNMSMNLKNVALKKSV